METGIYKNVPFLQYKEWPGVHKSMFRHILKSGLHLKHHLDHGEEESAIMRFGNLVDCLLLEPDEFPGRYTMIPETYPAEVKKETIEKPWIWTANFCKQWREDVLSEKPDTSLISFRERERASTIVQRILSHPEAQKWLSRADYQVSLWWIDPETELPCKARMDVYDGTRVADLKVTNNPHPVAFSKIVNDFKYHAGGAFYHDGLLHCMGITPEPLPSLPVSFIAAEESEPYDVVCYNMGPQSFEVGRIIYREALQRYKEYMDTQDFSGYSNVAEEIEIPGYALNRVQLEGVIV